MGPTGPRGVEDPRQAQETRVPLASLDRAHVGPVKAGSSRELFLGEAGPETEGAQDLPEPKEFLPVAGTSGHGGTFARLQTFSLQTMSIIEVITPRRIWAAGRGVFAVLIFLLLVTAGIVTMVGWLFADDPSAPTEGIADTSEDEQLRRDVYEAAVDACATFPPTRGETAIDAAEEYAAGYQDPYEQAAFEGCLEGFRAAGAIP